MVDADVHATGRYDGSSCVIERRKIVAVGEQRSAAEGRRGVPAREAGRQRLPERIRVIHLDDGAPALEQGLEPCVHDQGLGHGANNRPDRRPLVVRPAPQRPYERQHHPDEAELTERRGRIEQAVGDTVAAKAGEPAVDLVVEILDP